MEVLGEEDDEMDEFEDENIILDESALEGDQGTSGNVMAVQVGKINKTCPIRYFKHILCCLANDNYIITLTRLQMDNNNTLY